MDNCLGVLTQFSPLFRPAQVPAKVPIWPGGVNSVQLLGFVQGRCTDVCQPPHINAGTGRWVSCEGLNWFGMHPEMH